MGKRFKIISFIGIVSGGLCMLYEHNFMGFLLMFGSMIIGIVIDDTLVAANYSDREKKPYYKDEFEEYQHFKNVKKHLKK